jgi:hypothetical protein
MAVHTMRTYFGVGLADFLEHHHQEREKTPRLYHKRFKIPTASVKGQAVEAVVDHGRLIVRCPFCATGAEIVDVDDPRFFCLECLNAEAGGRFVPINVPADYQAAG